MKSWPTMQPNTNYELQQQQQQSQNQSQHQTPHQTPHQPQQQNWYNNTMYGVTIKTEPGHLYPPQHFGTTSVQQQMPVVTPQHPATAHLEQYIQQQMTAAQATILMDTMTALPPSSGNHDGNMSHYYMQQQLMQQEYQQHCFQQQQQQQQHHHHPQQQQQQQQQLQKQQKQQKPQKQQQQQQQQQQQLQQQTQAQQYQQQFQQAQEAAAQNQRVATTPLPHSFNPLTPPGLPSAVFPNSRTVLPEQDTPSPQPATATPMCTSIDASDKTPCNTPPTDTEPLDLAPSTDAIPPTDVTPTVDVIPRSKIHPPLEYVVIDGKRTLVVPEGVEDPSIYMPAYNSHGNMKLHKCKTCPEISETKVEFWYHSRIHMKTDKMTECEKCPFVTELKHHLEYHTRKHNNLKPFQCDECAYTCVNKSMLNSHKKSHSTIYQYRCAGCLYVTKYCHSFKLHLRKYNHSPGQVLDEEGVPNPSVVIDVYGTRRGPKNKNGAAAKRRKTKDDELEMPSTSGQATALPPGTPNKAEMPSTSNAAAAVLQGAPTTEMPSTTHQEAALQGHFVGAEIPLTSPQAADIQQPQEQRLSLAIPPANTVYPNTTELSALQQQQHQQQLLHQHAVNQSLATIFPFYALLAAQQKIALQQLQEQSQVHYISDDAETEEDEEEIDDEEDDDDDDDLDYNEHCERHGYVATALDLCRGTPLKEEPQEQPEEETPEVALDLKMRVAPVDTPLNSTASTSRRKGRVLQLDQSTFDPHSPEYVRNTNSASNSYSEMPTASTPILAASPPVDDANNRDSPIGYSSGNSSNGSTDAFKLFANSAFYECKYCEIYFKDAVLYRIHMGYHSVDDVFKCNMCGERCGDAQGLQVHIAHRSHV